MEAKKLFIKRDVDGTAQQFPTDGMPAIVSAFTYMAKRMGGAPSITATIYYPTPLDKSWTREEYVELMGEKYYVTSIPSSSKDNQSMLYKHDVTFMSRREMLDDTLFFDAVSNNDEDTKGGDKYRSNQTKFTFGGDITEFVSRINSSMKYCGVPYSVVIDDGYATTDVKEVSFDNQYLTEVLQLINTTYGLDYYWVGNVCHVGKVQHDLTSKPIEYGRNNALISVSKENSNAKIIDMITGYGSSDNIPYYYPNDDEYGKVLFETENFGKSLVSNVSLGKLLKWDSAIYGKTLTLCKNSSESYTGDILSLSKYNVCVSVDIARKGSSVSSGTGGAGNVKPTFSLGEKSLSFGGSNRDTTIISNSTIWLLFEFNGNAGDTIDLGKVTFSSAEAAGANHLGLKFKHDQVCYIGEGMDMESAFSAMSSAYLATIKHENDGSYANGEYPSSNYWSFGDSIGDGFSDYTKSSNKICTLTKTGKVVAVIGCKVTATNISVARGTRKMSNVTTVMGGEITYTHKPESIYCFKNEDGGIVSYEDSGIEINNINSVPSVTISFSFDGTNWVSASSGTDSAAKIRVTGRTWIFPSQNLMPSIYRESGGAERFYYAKNGTYTIPGTADKYSFKNIYKENNPHQGSVEFSDIKPTINGIRNDVVQSDGLGQLFGEIADVAFDSKDNDVTDSDNNYIHSYFYIKLHKFSGDYGFDLFKHALASENAKINLIKSNGCPACSFNIQCTPSKDKSKMYNCVSTDGNGNLESVRDDYNDYIFRNDEDAYNDTLNQDTSKAEIWIAVKKDNSTLGIVMPNAAGNFKPQKGDLFVITGIKPPKVLVTAAEKRLDEALIKYMSENNEDQFNFTIKFSRIFLQENQDFANKLNENSKIAVNYAGEKHDFFVSNYTVKVDDNALAEVEVELSNTLETSTSELKKTIEAVSGETVTQQLQGLANSGSSFNANVTDRLYLSKQFDDTAQGLITFAKGLASEVAAKLKGGATFGSNGCKFDKDGNVVVDTVRSLPFDEALERGFGFTKDAKGKYTLSVTDLMVWGKAVFNSLEIRKLYAVGGNVYLSGASSKIVRAVPVKRVTGDTSSAEGGGEQNAKDESASESTGTVTGASVAWVECSATDKDCAGWKCYILNDDGTTATQNGWVRYDQAKCQTFDVKSGVYEGVKNTYYWRLVTDVSTENETITETRTEKYVDADGKEQERTITVDLYDGKKFGWVVLSKTDCESTTNDEPKAGDTIVLDGHRMFASGDSQGRDQYNDESRTNVMTLETTGATDGSLPRIVALTGITDYKHSDGKNEYSNTVFILSPKEVVFVSSGVKWISATGDTVTMVNFRGNWVKGEKYGYYDQVSHNDSIWTCVVEKGTTTTDEPSDASKAWRKEISGGKDGTTPKVTKTELLYAVSPTVARPADSAFTSQMPDPSGHEGGFLWMKTVTTWSTGEKTETVTCTYIGKDGASGTSHGVALTIEKRTISSVEDDCLVVTFSKGDTDGVTTTNNVQDIGGYAQLYVDGKLDTSATARLNLGTSEAGELQKNAFPQVFTAGYVTVKWYDKEGGTLLGMGTLTRGTNGKDAVTYGVQITPYYETWSDAKKHEGVKLTFTKTTGTETLTYENVQVLGKAKVYADGKELSYPSDYLNRGNDKIVFESFTVDDTTTGKPLGTARVITVELLVSDTVVATANYALGKQGTDGKDAVEITVSPNALVFDTDDNGLVASGTSQSATVTCKRGGKDVTITSVKITGQTNCQATVSGNTVTINSVDMQSVTVDGETATVSKTSGSVQVTVTVDGVTYPKTIPFSVNVARYTGGIDANNKKLKTRYTELTNNGSITDLTEYKSEILQNAREISLHVMEKNVGRRNLLVGSAFRKQGEGCNIRKGVDADGIAIVGGYEGTNVVKITAVHDGYRGVWWHGGVNDSRNVKIKRNTKYTLSVWVKVASASGLTVYPELIYNQSETGGTNERDGAVSTVSYNYPTLKAGEWQLFTKTVQTDDKHDYAECNFWANTSDNSSTVDVLFCRPMLEEGEEYNGWTLSEQDYDYVGGNLLDGTATLAETGNAEHVEGTVTKNGMGESASVLALLVPTERTYVDTLQWSTASMGIKAGEDYVFSFYARASSSTTAGKIECYLYPNGGDVFTEDSEGAMHMAGDGSLQYGIVPTSQWKRYWVHWRPIQGNPGHVLIRLLRQGTDRGDYSSTTAYAVGDVVKYDGTYYACKTAGTGNTPSTSSSYWEARTYDITISQPKLEVGATMTEWTEKRGDMVDKAALYATGIDIDSKKITLTASNTTFRDNDGKELARIDQDGLRVPKVVTTDTGSGHTVISGSTTVWYQKDGVTPGIQVFYDEAGVPHFQFCGADGKVKYDFGPSGLQSFINDTVKAYSSTVYLLNVSGKVGEIGGKFTSLPWCYATKSTSGTYYVYHKQTPATPDSGKYDKYDGCTFRNSYSNENWPDGKYFLPNGWYVEPNDGNLPARIEMADSTEQVYYQEFYYYENGKRTRCVKAYMTSNANDPASRFMWDGTYEEI